MSGTTTATVAVLGLFVLVLAGGASGAVIEPESVDLQDPSNVAVSDGLGSGGGEVELLVELPDHSNASGMGAMQAHATATQTDIRKFGAQTPGVTVEHRFWLTNAVLVRVDTDRVSPTTLARIDGVRSITRNARVRVSRPQTQPATATRTQTTLTAGAGSTYGLTQIGAPTAWERYDTRGGGTSVTVLDTGVDPDHPDINLTGWAEFDTTGRQVGSNPQDFDSSGHGTHVSGTVAGGAASGQHIGVAPETTLSHGAVLTDCNSADCTGTVAQILGGMEWAVARGTDVLSMSLGGAGYNRGLIEPVRNAERAGTVVVAATGNRGADTSESPGNIPDAVGVGAVDETRDVTAFSGGKRIDTSSAWGQSARADWPETYVVPAVTAPGAGVESALPGGGYGLKSGTSMATPHVAGAVALVQAATASQLSPAEIKTALAATATKPADAPEPAGTPDTRYGAGVIDVPAAIDAVRDDTATAGFTVSPQSPRAGETVVLRATDDAAQYAWDLDADDTAEATGQTVTTRFARAGEYTVTLTVTSTDGSTDRATEPVTVVEPLSAAFTTEPVGADGRKLALNATQTQGVVETYEWDLVSDSAPDATGETTTFTFWTDGTYDVTLRVTAPDGRTDTTTQTVTVGAPIPPVVGTTPPADPDGDGLYDDVRGDGRVDVLDVQALFDTLDSPTVQRNAEAFAFAGVDTSQVSVLDVQALFNDLSQA
jgi:subtilisin family serine protease